MNVTLDRDSEIPLGTQLAWRLRALIASGALTAGDRLPPVRQLAEMFRVNINTVRAVYARLSAAGLISSEHGRGTFVLDRGPRPDVSALAKRVAREALREHVDPRELAALLFSGVGPGTAIEAPEVDPDADARRGLRAEIEALEHELARLEPRVVEELEAARVGRPGASPTTGARLVGIAELERTHAELASRVAEARRRVREARAAAAAAAQPEPTACPEADTAWPELLASLRPALGS